ncbi:MAG: hypothetical protein ACLKAK_03660 [Alkaliphilus sp.]
MYKQFCKNVIRFLEINNEDNYRSKIARELLALSDVEKYKEWRKYDLIKYKEVSLLVHNLGLYKNMFPSLKNFLYELWGYGFDAANLDEIKEESANEMLEKAKLVDLLLSTHYWS